MKIINVPLNIVGSSSFGRHPKINAEQTFNMIIADEWLVPFAGHKKVVDFIDNGEGRGVYNSTRSNSLYIVVDNNIYRVTKDLVPIRLGVLDTYKGNVFIAENNGGQIAFCDKKDIWIYSYSTGTFSKATLDFTPAYITFQDGYFIAPDLNNSEWRLSALNNGLSWPANPENIGPFQSNKADTPVACVPFPGQDGLLLVMGNIVSQFWSNTGAVLFPYQRNNALNIDYGCVSPATIAAGEKFVIWLGSNEKSGPAILMSNEGELKQISTDGINYKLAGLKDPENSYGSLYKLDGKLMYQLTFADPDDDFTLLYDFEKNAFFSLCNETMHAHEAKQIVCFNNKYYFISFKDGDLYELNSDYTTFDGNEIPRVRVCNTIRADNLLPFIANEMSFLMEQGESSDIGRIDVSLSYDGGVNFGNSVGISLNPKAKRKNLIRKFGLGRANELTVQLRFWGYGRFVVNNGLIGIYQ